MCKPSFSITFIFFAASAMSKATPIPFGMENGEILSMQITASSSQGPFHLPNEARLNNQPKGKNVGAWCPKKHNKDQWLQIDFGKERNIQQIATQVFNSRFFLTCVKLPGYIRCEQCNFTTAAINVFLTSDLFRFASTLRFSQASKLLCSSLIDL